jgi:hypothetical protein
MKYWIGLNLIQNHMMYRFAIVVEMAKHGMVRQANIIPEGIIQEKMVRMLIMVVCQNVVKEGKKLMLMVGIIAGVLTIVETVLDWEPRVEVAEWKEYWREHVEALDTLDISHG